MVLSIAKLDDRGWNLTHVGLRDAQRQPTLEVAWLLATRLRLELTRWI